MGSGHPGAICKQICYKTGSLTNPNIILEAIDRQSETLIYHIPARWASTLASSSNLFTSVNLPLVIASRKGNAITCPQMPSLSRCAYPPCVAVIVTRHGCNDAGPRLSPLRLSGRSYLTPQLATSLNSLRPPETNTDQWTARVMTDMLLYKRH